MCFVFPFIPSLKPPESPLTLGFDCLVSMATCLRTNHCCGEGPCGVLYVDPPPEHKAEKERVSEREGKLRN